MVHKKTNALGRVTSYEYDLLSRLKAEIDPLGQVTALLYDSMGNVISITEPNNTSTSYGYDLVNRLTKITYHDGQTVRYAYDKLGRRTSMSDSTGLTLYTYDALSRLASVTDGRGQTIRYSWTPNGQRESMTYPDGSIVTYETDLLDRIVGVVDAQGRKTSYEYDARGLLTQKSLPTGAKSTYSYDSLGQLLSMTYTNQRGQTLEQLIYAYDPVGNRTKMERRGDGDDEDEGDGSRVVSEYAYDALNQLVQVNKYNAGDPGSLITTTYNYDAVGNRLSKAMAWGDAVDEEVYTYNNLDQLILWQNDHDYKEYTYDLRGNMLQVIGRSSSVQADTLMMSVTDAVYGHAVTDFVYGDMYGQTEPFFMTMDSAGPKVLETYQWNSANRLVKQTNKHGDITRYAYDGDGNRVSMIVDVAKGPDGRGNGNGNGNNGNGKGNGNGNNGNGKGNGNNGNGNGNNGKWQDKCNHVVPPGFVPPGLAKKCGQNEDEPETYPIEHPSGPRDGWEHQFKKKHWEFHYTNDISFALPEPIQITEADPTKWKETFVYGAGGERISYTYLPAYDANNGWEPTPGAGGAKPGVQPKTLWYMTDALGSTLGMLEADGRVSSRYHYDEFGIVLDAKKFDPNWPGPDNLYGYTELGYDYYSGLTYARARYYNPEIGRFISEDSYKGSMWNAQSQNLYAYVHNNPLRYIDPTGHSLEDVTNWLKDAACFVCDDLERAGERAGMDPELVDQLQNIAFQESAEITLEFYAGDITTLMDSSAHWTDRSLAAVSFVPFGRITKLSKLSKLNKVDCNCFTAGTKILTDEGEKPIEEIEVGDRVLAKSDETGEVAYKEVVGLFQKQADEIYYVHIGDEIIEVTGEHPFWLDGKGWTFVKDLKVGDLLVSSDGTKLAIDKIEKEPREATVYNFQVQDFHSYFVSNLGIWVHNCLTWTGKGFKSLAKNNSANDLIKNLEDAGWTKTIEAGGKKSGDATIFVDPKTGTKVRIHANPGEGTPYFRVQNKGGNYLNDDGVFPSNATKQELRDQTHFYFGG